TVEPHASLADARAAGCGVLPQRRDLFRQRHAARSVRARVAVAAPRQPAVSRPFRKPLQGERGLHAHRQDSVSERRMSTVLRTAARPDQAPMLPAFAHMQRFWDPQVDHWTVKILPGEY